MSRRLSARALLPLSALGLLGILGGCVAYPAEPAYPAYGYNQPYYGGAYVGVGGGWHERHEHEGWRGREGWGDHDGGWRR